MIERLLLNLILKEQKEGFITLIHGSRRVGKTVLLSRILDRFPQAEKLVLNGDTDEARTLLGTTSEVSLTGLVANYPIIAIDEAQRIPNIGLSLKIIIDKFPTKKIFVTGSSSLYLAKGLHETLTGRTLKYKLFPLSTKELAQSLKPHEIPFLLENELIYGGYPYIQNLATPTEKQAYLQSITQDYLFKDLLELERLENPDSLKKLASLLAFQIGSEVSLNELATKLSINVKTVARYLNLLKESFVIFELGAFSSNLRDEVTTGKKYYFYDLGIRNALILQFHSLDVRTDIGNLWENFLAVERLKKHEYERNLTPHYFWRDYAKAEIDWIEGASGSLSAFEFKWKNRAFKTPKKFKDKYGLTASVVNKENYLGFIM
ncbi:MAG: ATP-binding protein [Patescibacteria group bacterium]